MRKITMLCTILIASMTLSACAGNNGTGSNAISSSESLQNSTQNSKVETTQPVQEKETINQLEPIKQGDLVATLSTSMGDIKIKLFPQVAPKAVENFTTHAQNGYYDGLTFHRIIKDFMIQGGDPKGNGTGGESIWGEPFEDEFHEDLVHIKGALSMANAGPSTNGSQFFIVQAQDGTPHLNQKHTVFGQVVEGMDIVDAIANVKVDSGDKPKDAVTMQTISIETVA